MVDEVKQEVLERVSEPRRSFLRKVVMGTSFVTPLIASFSMKAANAQVSESPQFSNQAQPPGALACLPLLFEGNLQGFIACVQSSRQPQPQPPLVPNQTTRF